MVVTLAHTHTLADPDSIFTIDPTTREITTTDTKIVLMQYDHNSEIFTFQIPRLVEGHDMSLCNKIEIHYTNINRRTKEQSKDVYPVTDQKVEGDNLVFTWLLSGNATKYAGTLNFIIRFGCLEEDNTFSYMWHTDIFKNITVSDGISNTAAVAEDHSDILENWKSEIDTNLEAMKPVQPDCNQNDSEAKDFIKNRTHYISSTEGTLIDATNLVYEDNFGSYYAVISSSTNNLVDGNHYNVTLDGASISDFNGTYDIVCNNGMLEFQPVVGDTLLSIKYNDYHAGYFITSYFEYKAAATSPTTITVTGTITEYHKLDSNFIGDDIARTDHTHPELETTLNLANGSKDYSLRMLGSNEEDSSYTMGEGAFAQGEATTAKAKYSHAEGTMTTVEGTAFFAHAEGSETMAKGQYSHAEGWKTKSNGEGSHSEGVSSLASGKYSHAEGHSTYTSGFASHSEGYGTTAGSDYQHVQGKYNIVDSNEVYAHIVGNGSDDSSKSNAATVDWSGNAWFSGDVYVGSTSGTNKDAGSKKLATTDEIDSLKSDIIDLQTALIGVSDLIGGDV